MNRLHSDKVESMKVLLVASTINREDIGESWVAYQWAAHLAERVDLTVLTYRKRGAPEVAPQLPGVRVVEWQEPPLFGRLERFNSLLKPGYFSFSGKVRRWIRQALIRGEHFDIAHQVVPVAMRYPTPLSGWDFPYLIGPVGGSLESPPGFVDSETGPWYLKLRALDRWRLQHDPWLRGTYESAACVLGIADYVRGTLAGLRVQRLEIMSETGLTDVPDEPEREIGTPATVKNPLRVLFVGRVIRTKGARDLVAAMALLRDVPVVADIVGDGFDLAACKVSALESGVSDRVSFHGRQDRPSVHGFYRDADVFVFPSYREPGGNVVFEAMGHELPLIVCDVGGPAAAVDENCAIVLRATTPAQLADDLAAAIRRLAGDPQLRLEMGRAARQRLLEVGLWPGKTDRTIELYQELIGAHSQRVSR